MRRRKNREDCPTPNSSRRRDQSGTRRFPDYSVHFKRNPFHDPALPPFWELTVENSRYSYRVLVGVPGDELDALMDRLPTPTHERHGVDFWRGVGQAILPEDIRRLTGETMMAFLVYKVMSAPPGSPYKKEQKFNDADLGRPITPTPEDIEADDRRKEMLLRQFEVEIVVNGSASPRF
ncbi:hypothetical protein [Ollibium composti]|uniref:Uncharacterized protein n=1 Tax=Ollibium composti TaxID=2675109 RepID=A0ABY2Q8F0_9HYPH|nr:hypothetical protein [Mesorhizobium composti]THF58145.1 hypothetical protein E6C48_05870 [Mesorhizobium composti]